MTGPLDDLAWLTGPAGRAWLEQAADSREPTVRLATNLRKTLSAMRARLVLEQVELRRRAAGKFDHAERLFFTDKALQQATDSAVARYKARRYPAGAPLADLCCGIGGDLLALARRGPVCGVERDPVSAIYAGANLDTMIALGEADPASEVRQADVEQFSLGDFAAWHIDPDRRPSGKRTTHVAAHAPPLEAIRRLLGASPSGCIKLAPASDLPAEWLHEAELEWISRDRECRQLAAWFGPQTTAEAHGLRRATVVWRGDDPHAPCAESLLGAPGGTIDTAAQIGRFVHEPDAAVLAADLLPLAAANWNAAAIRPGIAYLTSDAPIASRLAASFEVLEVMPFDRKRLRQAIRQRGIGRLEIKKRGLPDDPEQVHRELAPRGDAAAVLLLMPGPSAALAILAKRNAVRGRS